MKPYNYNCKQCYQLLDSYLDRELSGTEMAEVKLHLDHCPPCAKYFTFEESMLKFVKAKVNEVECPKGLFEKLCKGLPDD